MTSNIYFTSDQHYGHKNIIGYSSRPFTSVDEMNETMIERHNAVVKQNDTVFHLGDFSLNWSLVRPILSRLAGRHYLICGNHDGCHPSRSQFSRYTTRYMRDGFRSVHVRGSIELPDGGTALLSHFPKKNEKDPDQRYMEYRVTDADLEGFSVLLHGHVHERWKTKNRMINVGVDQWNFTPVSLEEVSSLARTLL